MSLMRQKTTAYVGKQGADILNEEEEEEKSDEEEEEDCQQVELEDIEEDDHVEMRSRSSSIGTEDPENEEQKVDLEDEPDSDEDNLPGRPAGIEEADTF